MNRTPPSADERLIALLEAHRRPVFAHALRLTGGDAAWAEDVVQETFVRAWQHAATMTPEHGSVRAWLLRVAHNLVMDEYRTARRRHGQLPLDGEHEVAEPEVSDVVLLGQVLRDALAQLPAVHREALEATYLADHTIRQAAGDLEVPVGTVKSRVFYGLRKLREIVPSRAA